MRAAGGTSVPLMLDWLIWLSIPNVNAEWEKPAERGREWGRGHEAWAEGCKAWRLGRQGTPLVSTTLHQLSGARLRIWGEVGRTREMQAQEGLCLHKVEK